MRSTVRRKLSYGNVMATLAVFMVLGRGAYAATGGSFVLGRSRPRADAGPAAFQVFR
jgi:hypothetical protein